MYLTPQGIPSTLYRDPHTLRMIATHMIMICIVRRLEVYPLILLTYACSLQSLKLARVGVTMAISISMFESGSAISCNSMPSWAVRCDP